MIRSEKTRQFIIEKTAPIFNKKGYTGTYLSDLTEATGLTKGSIYGNFKDKNEVAVEAFKYNYKFQTQKLLKELNEIESPIAKIMAFFSHFRTGFKAIFRNGGCVILNTSVDADDGNELLKVEVIKAINGWHGSLVTILDEAVIQKEIERIETETFAFKIIALLEGSLMLSKTLEKPEILLNNIDSLESEVLKLKII